MKTRILALIFLISGCTSLPLTPEDLSSPDRSPAIKTQEAILPNTTYEQMFQRMKAYSEKCLSFTKSVPCGANCKPTKIKFTPTIITDKNRLTLYLQKKGGSFQARNSHRDGFYLMSVHALTNGTAQQLMIHGVDNAQHGYTTQSTMDWLAGKKKLCPKL